MSRQIPMFYTYCLLKLIHIHHIICVYVCVCVYVYNFYFCQHVTVTASALWTIYVTLLVDSVNVEHKRMEENVINVNQDHGTIQIVKDVYVTDIQIHVILILENALIVKVLRTELIVIGGNKMKLILFI